MGWVMMSERELNRNRPVCPLPVPAPGQQVIDLGDFVVRDAGEGVGEPSLRIDGVQLGGLDQGVGDGGGAAARLRVDEEVIVPPEGDGAHAAFGGVVVQLKNAVVEVGTQAFHAGQGIADGHGEWGFARGHGELHGKPALQIVEDRCGVGPSQFGTLIRWRSSGLFLDGVELGDPADSLFGDWRLAIGEPCDRWMSTNLRRTWTMQATSWIVPDRQRSSNPA